MLYLRKAGLGDIEEEYALICDMPADENGMLNEWAGISFDEFRDTALRSMAEYSAGVDLPEGYVPETFYFLWNGGEAVGLFRLRQRLCPSLVNGGGHVGYYVKRRYRNMGFASEGLRLLLEEAKSIVPEDEIYLRVRKNNPASLRVMLKNGGYISGENENEYFVRIKQEK